MQEDVEVKANEITGTLKFIEGGLAQSGPLAGDGNFLALKFECADWTRFTSVKVGLTNSVSTGLVELINDPDKNGVFKITNITTQRFRVESTDTNGVVSVNEWDLSSLVCETE